LVIIQSFVHIDFDERGEKALARYTTGRGGKSYFLNIPKYVNDTWRDKRSTYSSTSEPS
jgi:hypothetical protein